MDIRLIDTRNDAERVQIELLRKANIAQRIQRMSSLSTVTRNLSRRAILRANPKFSEQEIDIAFVDLHYGHNLAEYLRVFLKDRANGRKTF